MGRASAEQNPIGQRISASGVPESFKTTLQQMSDCWTRRVRATMRGTFMNYEEMAPDCQTRASNLKIQDEKESPTQSAFRALSKKLEAGRRSDGSEACPAATHQT